MKQAFGPEYHFFGAEGADQIRLGRRPRSNDHNFSQG